MSTTNREQSRGGLTTFEKDYTDLLELAKDFCAGRLSPRRMNEAFLKIDLAEEVRNPETGEVSFEGSYPLNNFLYLQKKLSYADYLYFIDYLEPY